MKKKTLWQLIPLAFMILVIPAGVYLATNPDTTLYFIRAGESEEALLFLTPGEVNLNVRGKADFSLKIDTGRETAGGVRIIVNYDPEILSLAGEVQPGPAFTNLKVEEEPGQVLIEGKGSLAGQGTVASLSFEVKKWGKTTTVEIDQNSVVLNEFGEGNLLREAMGAAITID